MTRPAQTEGEAGSGLIDMCNKLFQKWMLELTAEEKEVWLWNASVDLLKIKQRRKT
jgi:hypothetical protein